MGDINPVALIWNFYFQVFAIIIVDCNQNFPQFTSVFTALRYIQRDSSQHFNKKVSEKYYTIHWCPVNGLKLLWDERPSSKLEVMLYGEISEEKMLIEQNLSLSGNITAVWFILQLFSCLFQTVRLQWSLHSVINVWEVKKLKSTSIET